MRTAEEMPGYGVLGTNNNRTLRETEVESHTSNLLMGFYSKRLLCVLCRAWSECHLTQNSK